MPCLPTLVLNMVSEKPWSMEAVVRLFISVIVTLCAGMALAGILDTNFVKNRWHPVPDQVDFAQMTMMVLFFQGAALVWVGIFLRQSNSSWQNAFGLRSSSWAKAAGIGLGIGILVLPFIWFLQWFSETAMEWMKLTPEAQPIVEALQKSTWTVPEKIALGILTVLLVPVAEEILFRGILYPTIKQLGYPRCALWGTSVLFGIMHFNMPTLVPLIVLALVLVFLYEWTDNLLAPIATHSVFNAVNFIYLVCGDQIDHLLHHK
jgi:membrane protease YdiL (CAAX protease family)